MTPSGIRTATDGSCQRRRSVARRPLLVAALLVLGGLGAGLTPLRSDAADLAKRVPAPAIDETAPANATLETAVFAGGCFWGVQGVFQHTKGVSNAVSGYAGGDAKTAHYDIVSTGTTGHAESVRVTYDPRQVSYGQLLQIFFSVAHDPTELNRQGPDTGTQYRSAIFTTSPAQTRIAKAYIAQLDKTGLFHKPIVTKVSALDGFYAAEDHHQNFLTLHPSYPYIVFNDLPKLANLQKVWPALYRAKPVLVDLASKTN